jgi:adenylate cyclase class IV
MTNKKNIEVELRSLINEKEFITLNNYLSKNSKDLGEDNKDSHFFIFPDKLLKVTDNITKNNAKITLKLQRIGLGSDFEELDVSFPREDVKKIVKIFDILGFKNYLYSYQNRHNYLYKNVEFAVKYTASWGFHCEMEIMVKNKKEVPNAVKQMKKVAKELKLNIMTDDELKKFLAKIETGWERGPYSKDEFKRKK